MVRAKHGQRMPVVLMPRDVRDMMGRLSGTMRLLVGLMYEAGMRLFEGLRLRVKDVELERREIVVREGKGNKDRVTVLPENLVLPLRAHPSR